MEGVECVPEDGHRRVDLVHHRLRARVEVDAEHALRELLGGEVEVGTNDRLGDDPDVGLLGQPGTLRLPHDLFCLLLCAATANWSIEKF